MAPEQAMGKASEIDARADVWAVGATLFSLISGLTVHEGDTGRELLVKLMTQPARALASVVSDAPRALAAVVDRALSVDRDRRWPTARAMREALEEAARQIGGELPARAELATAVAPLIPASTLVVPAEVAKPTRQWAPIVEPTMAVRERPTGSHSTPRPAVETSTPVLSERLSLPRTRAPVAISAVLLTVTAALALAVFIFRARGPRHDLTAKSAVAVLTAPPAPPPVVEAIPPPPPAAVVASSSAAAARTLGVVAAEKKSSTMSLAAELPKAKRAAQDAGTIAASPTPPATPQPAGSETPKPARPDCNPPFYYDSAYNRVFKKECL